MNTRSIAFGGLGYGHRTVAFNGWFADVTVPEPTGDIWHHKLGLSSETPLQGAVDVSTQRSFKFITPDQGIISRTPVQSFVSHSEGC